MTYKEIKGKYYVTATDKFMSGWGRCEGKTMKRVIVCNTLQEAKKVEDAMTTKSARLDGYRNVRVSVNKPHYSAVRYLVSFYPFAEGSGLYHWGEVMYKNFD